MMENPWISFFKYQENFSRLIPPSRKLNTPKSTSLFPPLQISCHAFKKVCFGIRGVGEQGSRGVGEQGRGFDDFLPKLKIYSLNPEQLIKKYPVYSGVEIARNYLLIEHQISRYRQYFFARADNHFTVSHNLIRKLWSAIALEKRRFENSPPERLTALPAFMRYSSRN